MAGRAVVLTTHSMVEADFLCDRIGIMVQGQLRCLGTSDHLKQRHASGYELVVKIEDDALEGVSKFVKERFGATLAAADAGTLTYELSKSSEKSADLLADAFQAFDESTRQSLKVAEFSVVQASLEKVFIRIVSGEGGEHEARDAHNRSVQVAQDLGDDSDDDLDNFQFRERTCCKCSYFAHGLLCKYHSTCCCAMCCYMFMSIFGASWFVWFTPLPYLPPVPAVANCVGAVVCRPKVMTRPLWRHLVVSFWVASLNYMLHFHYAMTRLWYVTGFSFFVDNLESTCAVYRPANDGDDHSSRIGPGRLSGRIVQTAQQAKKQHRRRSRSERASR